MKHEVIIGLDLAGKERNPTGLAIWKQNEIEACLVYTDKEILEIISLTKPSIVAIDSPLKLPKKGIFRKADIELVKKGYRVFPPGLPAMKALTARAMTLDKLIKRKGIKTIEVHPTSTRKALNMPTKNWEALQVIFKKMGLKGSLEERSLTSHELDAITAALTAHLYLNGLTEEIGDEEGLIVVPKRIDWREIRL